MKVGTPSAKLPVSATMIASASQEVGMLGHELLEAARPLLLRAFGDELDADPPLVRREHAAR